MKNKKIIFAAAILLLALSAYGINRYLAHKSDCQWWRNRYAEAKTGEANASDLYDRAVDTGDPKAVKVAKAALDLERITLRSSQEYLIKYCGEF